jgi:hypothetical protein
MSVNGIVKLNVKPGDFRRQSVLVSSNPKSDSLPIDCILVYDRTDHDKESDVESNDGHNRRKHLKPSQRRKKFEDYLCKKQGLILNRVVSRRNFFE